MEWRFLILVLKAFGFNEKFSNLIYQCISTIQFSLLFNGGVCSSFTPSHGLRQGEPISLYLFILGSEVLMRLINKEISQNNLSKVKVTSMTPLISKLCYTHNVILFCKAKSLDLFMLKNYLVKYFSWSGQISVEKSGMFPYKGVGNQFLSQIKFSWGLNILPQYTTSLGVLLFFSKNRSQDLINVKEKLESKLSNWKRKNFSWARRATIIKYVAQSIPAYSMSAIQFSKNMCDQLNVVFHKFWWNPK